MTNNDPRPLTRRERDVLVAMLSADSDGIEALRAQATVAMAFGFYDGGAPSIYLSGQHSRGLFQQSNAAVAGTGEGIVLWTSNGELHSLEYFGTTDRDPSEFPDPSQFDVSVPGRH